VKRKRKIARIKLDAMLNSHKARNQRRKSFDLIETAVATPKSAW